MRHLILIVNLLVLESSSHPRNQKQREFAIHIRNAWTFTNRGIRVRYHPLLTYLLTDFTDRHIYREKKNKLTFMIIRKYYKIKTESKLRRKRFFDLIVKWTPI